MPKCYENPVGNSTCVLFPKPSGDSEALSYVGRLLGLNNYSALEVESIMGDFYCEIKFGKSGMDAPRRRCYEFEQSHLPIPFKLVGRCYDMAPKQV